MTGPTAQDKWLQHPSMGVAPEKFDSAPGGGDTSTGLTVNLVIPVETPEMPAWNGKIKVKYKGKITVEATVGGEKGAAVITLDTAKGIGEKATKTWWQGTGTVTLRGIDIFKDPKLNSEGAINKEGVTVKSIFSVETPLGTVSVAATVFEYKPPKPVSYGTLGGSLKSKKFKIPDVTVDGFKVHDIAVTTDCGFEVAPQYVKIIADAMIESLKKSAQSTAETVGSEAALGFAIEASLVVVAVGTVAGVFNELSKAVDQKQLLGQVEMARNMFTTGLGKALRGEASPGSGWPGAGWRAGKKVFDDAVAKAKSLHPDWSDDDIRDRVVQKAGRLEADPAVQNSIKRFCGQGFWNRWIEANHGLGTFLGDAKAACGACFGKGLVDDKDPDLDAWKKVSSLPDFFADR